MIPGSTNSTIAVLEFAIGVCWETGCLRLLNPLYLLCSIHEESLHPSWSSAAGHSTADFHFGLQKLTTRSEAWEWTGYRCKSILTYLCNSQFWSSICTCTCLSLRSPKEEWTLWYEPVAVAWKASSISPAHNVRTNFTEQRHAEWGTCITRTPSAGPN